jgi:hypothetical protein
MSHLSEVLVYIASHTDGWGVRVCHLRMSSFEFLKFVHKEVEVLVGDDRLIENVITMIMFV